MSVYRTIGPLVVLPVLLVARLYESFSGLSNSVREETVCAFFLSIIIESGIFVWSCFPIPLGAWDMLHLLIVTLPCSTYF